VSADLTPVGPVTLVTLDEDSVVTDADAAFETLVGSALVGSALVGSALAGDDLATGAVRLADLLADGSARTVLQWCRTGADEDLVGGVELRGRRRDGLPLVLRAHGVPGSFARSSAAVIDAQRPHRRLLLQRAGGVLTWTGSAPPPFPARTGPDHVLAHDLRGAVRTARTFLGLHQRRLAQGVEDARAGGVPVPDAIVSDPSVRTATRALATAEDLVDALVRFERVGTDPLVVGPVRLVDVVGAAAERSRSICDALAAQDGQRDLAGGLDVRWDGPPEIAVVGDPELLTWVVAELFVNARKYGRAVDDPLPDPAITVSARSVGPWVDVLVASRGRVIDPVLAPDAFALGRQLQPRGERPGAGLGLALCRRIVARHAGRIGFLVDHPATGGRGGGPGPDDGSGDGTEVPFERPRGTTIVELQLLAERA